MQQDVLYKVANYDHEVAFNINISCALCPVLFTYFN